MKRTNYFAVVLENGYLDGVFTSRAEAEAAADKINSGTYSGGGYYTYSAEVVRGMRNIILRTGACYCEAEIKRIAQI